MSLQYLLLLVVISSSTALKYGRKGNKDHRRSEQQCNRYDPEPITLGSLDNIAGKRWNLIYVKKDSTYGERILLTDEMLEFHKSEPGSNINKGIFQHRLGVNSGICTIDQSKFSPLPGREGKEWKFKSAVWGDLGLIKPYKYLYNDEHFLVSWECFERNPQGACIDFFSGIYRDKRNQDIPLATLKEISKSVKQRACLDFNSDYVRENIRGNKKCKRFKPF